MKNRRQFLVDNVAAWFLAPELAKRIEWVAQHEDKSYLPRIRKPRQKLYASEACDGFYLCLNGPFEEDEPGKITWAQYFDIIGVDITDQQAVQDWADEDLKAIMVLLMEEFGR